MNLGLINRTRLLAFVGLLGVVTFLHGPEPELRTLRMGAKAVPLLCLLLWMGPVRERYARLIRVGLVLSLLGDLLLEASPDLFLPALGAFLLAHVAYVAAYVTVTRRPSLARGMPFTLLGLGLGALLWPRLGDMALPVTAYIAVICAMMWRSAAMLGGDGLGRREQWAALAGALMFAMSDTLLAFKLFMRPVPGSSHAIMLLYWAGQLGITLSARASPSPRPSPLPHPGF